MKETAVTGEEQTQARREAILAEYAEEEAEAAEIEVAENTAALDVPLNLRITKSLDAQLGPARRRGADPYIGPGAQTADEVSPARYGAGVDGGAGRSHRAPSRQ